MTKSHPTTPPGEAKHTPLPWTQNCFLISGAKGERVAHTGINGQPSLSKQSEIDAIFIVEACNNFEQMKRDLASLGEEIKFVLGILDRQDREEKDLWDKGFNAAFRALSRCTEVKELKRLLDETTQPPPATGV